MYEESNLNELPKNVDDILLLIEKFFNPDVDIEAYEFVELINEQFLFLSAFFPSS